MRRLDTSLEVDVLTQVFEEKSREWAEQQARLRAEIEVAERQDFATVAKAAQIFRLAARAPEIWKNARCDETRRELLQVVGSNSIWDGVSLTIEFAQPFDSLALLSGQGVSAGPALSVLSVGGSDLVSQQVRRSLPILLTHQIDAHHLMRLHGP